MQQIDRACTPALWCALTREKDFDEKNGLPAREDRAIRVHGHEIKSSDYIQVFSKRKKTDSDRDETPFGAIAVRGGFVEIGPSIHHARIYRVEGKKPVYAMLRVFTHDLLSQRHGDLFSAVIPPQSISMRCAEPKLRKAITTGNATYLGWSWWVTNWRSTLTPSQSTPLGVSLKTFPTPHAGAYVVTTPTVS